MSSPVYSEFSFAPASAYAADVNALPELREAVQESFSEIDWRGSEAGILGIEMISEASFSVQVNRETKLTAKPDGGAFKVQYHGPIEYIVFASEATLSYCALQWAQENKTHGLVTITAAQGASVSRGGYSIPKAADGAYELAIGAYMMTVDGVRTGFIYNLEKTLKVRTSIASANVVLGAALTYTGSEQKKEVTSVTLGEQTLTDGTDYTVQDDTGTDAGNYSLRIDGIGNYAGTLIAPWRIAKAEAGLALSQESAQVKAGESADVNISTDSDTKITVQSSDAETADASVSGNVLTIEAKSAGAAEITLRQAEGKNYMAGEAHCAVTVTGE